MKYLIIYLSLLFLSCTNKDVVSDASNLTDAINNKDAIIVKSLEASGLGVYDTGGVFKYAITEGIVRGSKNSYSSNNNNDFIESINFSQTDLAVNVLGKFRFYDSGGKIKFEIKSNYQNIFSAKDGHYLAAKYNQQSKSLEYQFLTRDYKPSFSYEAFKFATEFNKGRAVVGSKLKLFVIDKDGKELSVLPEQLSTNVEKLYEISNDLVRMDIKVDGYLTTEFYNLKTQEILRRSDGQYFGPSEMFINGKSLTRNGKEITSFSDRGEILSKIPNTEIVKRNGSLLQARDSNGNTQVYDYTFKKIESPNLPERSNVKILNEELVSIEQFESGRRKYIICDPISLAKIFESEVPVYGKIGSNWICGSYDLTHSRINFVGVNQSKVAPLRSDFEQFIYTDLVTASKDPSRVKNAQLFIGDRNVVTTTFYWQKDFINDKDNLAKINELTRLENLVLQGDAVLDDIDFSKLINLKSLWIISNKAISALPVLKSNSKLETLKIDLCPNLKQIEKSILNIPNLKMIKLTNYTLNQETVDALKQKNADVDIEFHGID